MILVPLVEIESCSELGSDFIIPSLTFHFPGCENEYYHQIYKPSTSLILSPIPSPCSVHSSLSGHFNVASIMSCYLHPKAIGHEVSLCPEFSFPTYICSLLLHLHQIPSGICTNIIVLVAGAC